MEITTLIDRETANDKFNLVTEFGLALYINHNGKQILFDTGRSGQFIENAGRLGIDITAIDHVVISSSHRDHTGGLKRFLKENSRAMIYIRKDALHKHYYRPFPLLKLNLGADKRFIEENIDRFSFTGWDHEIAPGIQIISRFSNGHFTPSTVSKLYTRKKGKLIPDKLEDEQALCILENNHVFCFIGSPMHGVLNMMDTIHKRFPGKDKVFIGGMNLLNPVTRRFSESIEKLVEIATYIQENQSIRKMLTGHCTGNKAFRIIEAFVDSKIEKFAAGSSFQFDY